MKLPEDWHRAGDLEEGYRAMDRSVFRFDNDQAFCVEVSRDDSGRWKVEAGFWTMAVEETLASETENEYRQALRRAQLMMEFITAIHGLFEEYRVHEGMR